MITDGRVTPPGRDEFEDQSVEWFGQDDGLASQVQPNVVFGGLDVVDG